MLRPWGRRPRDGPPSSSTADCSGDRPAWSSIWEQLPRVWVRIAPQSRLASSMDGGGVLVSLGGDLAVAGESPLGGWPILVAEDPIGDERPSGHVVRFQPRWGGHFFGPLPSLAPRRPHVASHHRPTHRRAGAGSLAHGDGGRTHVCPRQRCIDGTDRRGRGRGRHGHRSRTAGAADRARRFSPSDRVLAGSRRRRPRRSCRGPPRLAVRALTGVR